MFEGRDNFSATLLPDGAVLVAGGGHGPSDVVPTTELYSSSNESWTSTALMLEARAFHSATLLPDGRVLVAGGGGSSDFAGFGRAL